MVGITQLLWRAAQTDGEHDAPCLVTALVRVDDEVVAVLDPFHLGAAFVLVDDVNLLGGCVVEVAHTAFGKRLFPST